MTTTDPQTAGAALVIVGVLTIFVLGIAHQFLSGGMFRIVAGGWLLVALGFVMVGMGGSA
jgi:K+ transporter